MYTSGEFILHRNNTPFANRQKLLFDELLTAERDCNKNHAIDTSADVPKKRDDFRRQSVIIARQPKTEMRKFLGRESIFKRPDRPAPRAIIKSIPDHHKNPHKWVKYSLGDVSNEDMTEQSNTQAAMSFLKELRARKQQEHFIKTENQMDIDGASSSDPDQMKVPFKKRTTKANTQIQFKKPKVEVNTESSVIIDTDDKPVFKSSKVVMPEYVVGQKQKRKVKKDKQISDKISRTKELKLGHLDEPDEEEDS